jgi:hypothetical protein
LLLALHFFKGRPSPLLRLSEQHRVILKHQWFPQR